MPVARFDELWRRLDRSKRISRILLNNTGDLYLHPQAEDILQIIDRGSSKRVILTTNGVGAYRLPKGVDEFILSFNGGTIEAYEKTTGLPAVKVMENVRALYPELSKIHAEIHCLICEDNEGTDDALLDLWHDWPGRIRVSYKYDNQMLEDRTLVVYRDSRRGLCDYLMMLSIAPSGRVVSCAHDWWQETNFGNVFSVDDIDELVDHPNRLLKIREHAAGVWSGICKNCNYNVPVVGKVKYLR